MAQSDIAVSKAHILYHLSRLWLLLLRADRLNWLLDLIASFTTENHRFRDCLEVVARHDFC